MKWSFTIAKLFGTRVQIHLTFLLLLVFVAAQYYFASGAEAAVRGVFLIISVFFCVLLHEFGHVAAALKYGITTPKITLYPIGGIASLTRIPKKPLQELVVAAAGPAVNLTIALIIVLIRGNVPTIPAEGVLTAGFSIIDALFWVNASLFFFNLIPAFPMDGGRMFRALLGLFLSRGTATHLAVTVGQVIAIAGAIWAMSNGQILLTFIAAFIFLAGKGEETMVDQELLLEGHTAGEAGMSDFKTFHLDDKLNKVIDKILEGDQDVFPVINDLKDCIAAISFNEVIAAIQHYGPDAHVRDAVNSVPEQIPESTPAFDAWQKLARSRMAGAAVVDEAGHLKKWLTNRQFSEFMVVQALAGHKPERSLRAAATEEI